MQPNSNSKNFIIIGLVVLFLIIVVGFLSTSSNTEPTAVTQAESDSAREAIDSKSPVVAKTDETNTTEESEVVMETDHENIEASKETVTDEAKMVVEKDPIVVSEPVPVPVKASKGTYDTYNANTIANSSADDIVLFFKASWCPSCNALNKNITANLEDIPAGTEIYTVDFDTSIDLRKKYGVTTQHTLVHIQKDGALIKKWSGGTTLKSVLASL